MALKTVFEYCFNAIEFYPKSNRFVLASRRKSNHFVLKIRLGGFADYSCRRIDAYQRIHIFRIYDDRAK